MDIFGGVITKLGYTERSYLCILGSFRKVKVQNVVQNGGYFYGVAKIANIVLGVLEIPDIFGGEWQMLGPSLHMKKK